MRLRVSGGTLVGTGGREAADVLCDDGEIVAILTPGEAADADEELDASGLLVFPGFIDPHVHGRDPGITSKEEFGAATAGALASGLTTIFDMPNAAPPVSDASVFAERAAHHEQVAWTDFGLWGQALGAENVEELGALVAAGTVGIKLFWGYALDRTSGRLVYTQADAGEDADIALPPDIGGIYEIIDRVGAAGGLFAAHCEEPGILRAATGALADGIQEYDHLLAGRPSVAESVAVGVALEIARAVGCRVHIVHVSAARTAELIRRARAEGEPVSGEACIHYLVLDDGDYDRLGPAMKVYPPIRTADQQAELWNAIGAGTLTVLASDHAPHAPEEKARPLAEQPAGIHGVETLVPLVLDRMSAGALSPERVAGLLAENTARIFQIDHRKGSLRVGLDADLTLVDPVREWSIAATGMHTKHPLSVFDGRSGQGAAVAAVIRGELAMRVGEPVGEPRGALVRAEPVEG